MLAFGEDDARARGVDVERVKLIGFAIASIVTGAAVSVSGIIGFVGLLVPHLVRLIWRRDFRFLLPLCVLCGAALLVLSDSCRESPSLRPSCRSGLHGLVRRAVLHLPPAERALMLRIENASFAYDGADAVRSVTLEVGGSGSLVALAGPNGSGKSTLLKMIARVLRPRSGEILFDGKKLSDWPARDYATKIGYLPQEIDATFPMRAIDVVVSGRAAYLGRFSWETSSDYAKAEEALDTCDASHLAGRFLDEMSGGERKRVFLARVLAGAPRLILLDEPFAALTSPTSSSSPSSYAESSTGWARP